MLYHGEYFSWRNGGWHEAEDEVLISTLYIPIPSHPSSAQLCAVHPWAHLCTPQLGAQCWVSPKPRQDLICKTVFPFQAVITRLSPPPGDGDMYQT